ncbi:MAG: hypothetical protein HOE30_08890, partial [Deltaproteobacteria bacterium]|nr:hypothetical protein [Deltaproteobacteria bacterium]
MENTTERSKKSLAIWGIPIAILVILIVVLIFELNSGEDVVEKPVQEEEVVVQATDSKAEGVTLEVQPMLESEKESEESYVTEAETTAPEKEIEDADNKPKLAAYLDDDEAEKSYIVQEGDNLWKIAKKKDFLGDPWKWKTILIQNKCKINYTI